MAEMYACYSSVYSGCNYATDNGQCACNDPGLWPRYTNCLANTEHRICHSDIGREMFLPVEVPSLTIL